MYCPIGRKQFPRPSLGPHRFTRLDVPGRA